MVAIGVPLSVKLILMIAEAEAYCIESVSRSSRRLADLGDGVSAYAAAAAQTRGYDPNRPETSGTVAQGELNSFVRARRRQQRVASTSSPFPRHPRTRFMARSALALLLMPRFSWMV